MLTVLGAVHAMCYIQLAHDKGGKSEINPNVLTFVHSSELLNKAYMQREGQQVWSEPSVLFYVINRGLFSTS